MSVGPTEDCVTYIRPIVSRDCPECGPDCAPPRRLVEVEDKQAAVVHLLAADADTTTSGCQSGISTADETFFSSAPIAVLSQGEHRRVVGLHNNGAIVLDEYVPVVDCSGLVNITDEETSVPEHHALTPRSLYQPAEIRPTELV